MNDNGNDTPTAPSITLTITFDPVSKAINVNGPTDLVVAMGMLEMAKHAFLGSAKRQASPLVGATGPLPPFIRGRG